jgi:hypothetical protein
MSTTRKINAVVFQIYGGPVFSGGNSLFPVGVQSLLNFRQNFQISDIPPPFAVEKTVFSPLLGQNFRKFVNFPWRWVGAAAPPRPNKISATASVEFDALQSYFDTAPH